MDRQERRNKNQVSDDARILALYLARDENAIAETDRKYGKYLFTVAYNALHDPLDAKDCLQDAYVDTWNAIPPTVPRVFKAFLATVTRRLAIKRYYARQKKRAIPSEMTVSLCELEDFVAGDGDVDAAFDARRLGAILSDFIRSLSDRRQFIFMSRYYASEPIDTVARHLRHSRSAVNKELAAIRSALKEKLESEGYSV